jgi:hypothetical protein
MKASRSASFWIMAKLNPGDAKLQQMVDITTLEYNRRQAPELLSLSEAEHPLYDTMRGNSSLWQSVRATLKNRGTPLGSQHKIRGVRGPRVDYEGAITQPLPAGARG